MSERLIRVLIVDDHATVRRTLTLMLETYDDIRVIGEATDGQEAVELAGLLQPDVVLMDLLMPIMDGIQATQIIRERSPGIQVIVLTSFADQRFHESATQAGISHYFLKNVSIEEIANAIRATVG